MESQKIGKRDSNIELLRIILMIMILGLHANFVALGVPGFNSFRVNPISDSLRIFWESVCIGAVNAFVLISGWYGIKSSIKGLLKLLFQCLFFSVLVYLCSSIFTKTFSIYGLMRSFLLLADFWFVKAYIALYIFAPVLNWFIKCADKKTFSTVLGGLLLFQLVFGCTNQVSWIGGGYSFYSLVCLYLIARYVRIYLTKLFNYRWILFCGGMLGSCIFFICGLKFHISNESILYDIAFWYISPFVMISALGLLLIFLNFKIKYNKLINYIATSSFAVFLLHGQAYFWNDIFIKGVVYIDEYFKSGG